MKKTILLISALILLSLPLSGCEVSKDAVTGKKTVRIDPNAAAKIEGGAEAGVGILNALSVMWPGFAAGAGALTLALREWRKVKGKLTEKQNESDMYYNTTEALVTAIEQYRDENPDKWKKLKEKIEKAVGPGAESIIRAIRELPQKV